MLWVLGRAVCVKSAHCLEIHPHHWRNGIVPCNCIFSPILGYSGFLNWNLNKQWNNVGVPNTLCYAWMRVLRFLQCIISWEGTQYSLRVGVFLKNHSLTCKMILEFLRAGKKLNPVLSVMTTLNSCSKKSIGRAADKSFGKNYRAALGENRGIRSIKYFVCFPWDT